MRTAARRDKNEPEIVEALIADGCLVFYNNAPGFPDLTILFPRHNGYWASVLIEVKEPGIGRLTPPQLKWWMAYYDTIWPERDFLITKTKWWDTHENLVGPAYIVVTPEQALSTIEFEKEL